MNRIVLILMLSAIIFKTDAQTLQSITDNGNTTTNRISVNTGTEGLALVGHSYLSFKDPSNLGRNGYIQHNGSDLVVSADLGAIRLYGRVAVGTELPYGPTSLHVKAVTSSAWGTITEASTNRRIIGMSHTGSEGVIAVSYLDESGFTPLQFWTANIPRMTITAGGDLGIGTTDPKGYRLAVNGKIRAQEIKVETSNWPDYVFAKNYQLSTLQETEKHIKEKGHLPGIPSAEDVKTNGIDLGEMNAKLLQKIEELTLHLIEMNSRLRVVENENAVLKKSINK
uniref:hypothetical protein n=1 Tax=Pedobacter schmidteae TaxID=2201271 RepID=UPI0013CE6A73|nr:hypothetical protein [Pedobacter schmidteae]